MDRDSVYIHIKGWREHQKIQAVLKTAGEDIYWIEDGRTTFPAVVFYDSNFIITNPPSKEWVWVRRDYLEVLGKSTSITIEELEQLLKQK